MSKVILHVDMDAFFASIEQAVNPRLKNKPVIVGSRASRHSTVVAAASYEAKAFGVESGMSARSALRACPHAILVPADSAKYVYTSEEIHDLLKGYSPRVEMASIDEFYLDVTGFDAAALGREIREKIFRRFHITASVGIAPNRILAKMASKACKPDGLLLLAENEIPRFLETMPVERVPGIGPSIGAYLRSIGIRTCGQLKAIERNALVRRYGKIGLWLYDIARGRDVDVIGLVADPREQPKSVGHSYTLPRTVYRENVLNAWIRLLSEMVAARLRRYALEGKIVHLYVRQDDFANLLSRQKNFSVHTAEGEEIYGRCVTLLRRAQVVRLRARALGVSVSGIQKAQRNVLFEEDRKRRTITDTVDRVNGRFGEWTIYPAVLSLTRVRSFSEGDKSADHGPDQAALDRVTRQRTRAGNAFAERADRKTDCAADRDTE